MTKTVAKEVGKHNIRVNLIAPGVMEAGLSQSLPAHRLEDYLKHCGMKRLGKVSEIANVVVWFALHNEYVSGQSIVVDGAL
jgi:NAD(P)-dependent dehydrogenase (short-subunit alcohol dehydrogenase family)